MNRLPVTSRQHGQQGVAALVVVMVLLFIVSLVAAYTSRNLIFEQRTSANQYRSTQAIEAAEAGLEWALAMLNHGRITSSCTTSALASDTSFRQRYLIIDSGNGNISARQTTAAPPADLLPTCVFDGANWSCDCPSDAAPSLTAPSGSGVYPAFRVRFRTLTGSSQQPGLVRIESNGCTRLDDSCLNFDASATGVANEGRAYVAALVGLTGSAAGTPAAALTALGDVTLAGGAIYNTNLPIQAGGAVTTDPSVQLLLAPGSPGGATVVQNDGSVAALATNPNRLFPAVFNMWSATFREQPGLAVMDCAVVACNAATLRETILMNPGRPIWVDGDLTIDSAGDIGTATSPVAVVVTGNVSAGLAGVTLYGVLYVQAADWPSIGNGQVQGAVVVEGNLAGGAPQISYDAALLNVLRLTSGSFVRVPGSWRDFPEQ
jgi:hypothetical protein